MTDSEKFPMLAHQEKIKDNKHFFACVLTCSRDALSTLIDIPKALWSVNKNISMNRVINITC